MKSDYLDPRWQQFRLKRLELSDWKCEVCTDSSSTLHIHHRFYISGRKPWEYLPGTTQVLCDECHDIQHDFQKDFKTLGADKWEQVLDEACDLDRCLVDGFGVAQKSLKDIMAPDWAK